MDILDKVLIGEQTFIDKMEQIAEAIADLTSDTVTSVNGKIGDVILKDNDIPIVNDDNKTVHSEIVRIDGRLDAMANTGRFLAIWNAATGLPTSEPENIPYEYHAGDYYRVGSVDAEEDYAAYDTTHIYNIGDKCSYNSGYWICAVDGTTGDFNSSNWTTHAIKNYIPNGYSYTGAPSTTEATDPIVTADVFYYDGTVWRQQAAGSGGTVQDVQINGTSILNSGVATIPKGNYNQAGVFQLDTSTVASNLQINNGKLRVYSCEPDWLTSVYRNSSTWKMPIGVGMIDFAVKKCLTDGIGPAYTDTEKAAARTRIGAGVDNIFFAEYNVTSYDDIVSAIDSGKMVFAKSQGEIYTFTEYKVTGGYVWFQKVFNNPPSLPVIKRLFVVKQDDSTVWGAGTSNLQITDNLTTTLSGASTNTQYPGAKAVYDALSAKGTVNKIEVAVAADATTQQSVVLEPDANGKITIPFWDGTLANTNDNPQPYFYSIDIYSLLSDYNNPVGMHRLRVKMATEYGLANRVSAHVGGAGVIYTYNYDAAVKHALCDADGTQNPAYTDAEKAAARTKIGAQASIGIEILEDDD